jgi:hypothetical protein
MAVPKIESYSFGEIVIDGQHYSKDVIIYPDHVDGHWWREEGHSLAPEDIWDVLQTPPDVLVIGQGSSSQMDVPYETRRKLHEAGIEIIAEPTERACKTYNRLRARQRVVAALHLTC